MNITRNLIAAVLMTIVTTVLLGIVYPLAITAIAQVAFPHQANGQLIERNGKVVGSSIIGAGVLVAGVLPSAAVGGRNGLRRGELGRHASSARRTRSSSTPSRPTSRRRAQENPERRRCPSTW